MEREAMNLAAMATLHRLEESVRPAQIHIVRMSARAGRDQERFEVNRELCDELAILRGVFSRLHITAAPPRFVADAPILHAEWLFGAIGRAFVRQTFSSRRGVAIRDPIMKFPGRA